MAKKIYGYHVNPKTKQTRPCRAEPGNCRFGASTPHFSTAEECNAYIAHKYKQEIVDYSNITDTTVNYTYTGSNKTFEKNIVSITNNLHKKLEKLKAKYIKGYSEDSDLEISEYLSQFDEYVEAEQKYEFHQRQVQQLRVERAQVQNFLEKFEGYTIAKSYSQKSTSTYIVMKSKSLKKLKTYLNNNGYEYDMRENIEEIMGDNYEIRWSNHKPKGANTEKEIWKKTKSAIVIYYKDKAKNIHNVDIAKHKNIPTYNGVVVNSSNRAEITQKILKKKPNGTNQGELKEEIRILIQYKNAVYKELHVIEQGELDNAIKSRQKLVKKPISKTQKKKNKQKFKRR